MKHSTMALSIEELAYAMGVLGGTDAATGFLLGILGQRPRLEVEGRLLAAAHGLVARGYLGFDAAKGSSWLTQPLAAMVEPMVRNRYTVRLSRVRDGSEEIATLYVSDASSMFHQLHQGVVSHLQLIPDLASAEEQCRAFFALPEATETASAPLAQIPTGLLETLRRKDEARSVEEAATALVSHGLESGWAAKLAEDSHNETGRGSVVRLETQGDEVVSCRGVLILRSARRSWLFDISATDPDVLDVYPGTSLVFSKVFRALTS